jgi:hypothetical protein
MRLSDLPPGVSVFDEHINPSLDEEPEVPEDEKFDEDFDDDFVEGDDVREDNGDEEDDLDEDFEDDDGG